MSGSPLKGLNETGANALSKYLRFFRAKKDGLIRTILRECDETREHHLHEDMYSKEEVENFADFLVGSVRNHIISDLGSIINMSALSISQLLEGAAEKGVDLDLEITAVENQALLEAVEKMSLDAIPRGSAKRGGGLSSLKDDQRQLKESLEEAEESNKNLQDEVSALTRKLAVLRRSGAEGKQSEEQLEDALREAKEENDKRVRETNQFQQMKKMMQTQGATIRDLRKRLQHYEPEDVGAKEDF